MVFKNLCILVLWTKVALALEGLMVPSPRGLGFLSGFSEDEQFNLWSFKAQSWAKILVFFCDTILEKTIATNHLPLIHTLRENICNIHDKPISILGVCSRTHKGMSQ